MIVDGDRYRPLTVRETARAMGFPESYAWPAVVRRRQAVAMLGNAVAPPVAAALVRRLRVEVGYETDYGLRLYVEEVALVE